MGLTLDLNVPAITVLLQGFLSFFSPCVLPLLPLYIGYLSRGTGKWKEGKVDGNWRLYKILALHKSCLQALQHNPLYFMMLRT